LTDERFPGPSIRTRVIALTLVLTCLIGLPTAAILWMTSVPGRSHQGPLLPLRPQEAALAARLRTHVEAIASEPHNTAHPEQLERAALYLETALAGMGYAVARQPFTAAGVQVRNLEAVIAPASADAPTLVVGAHYDSYFDAPGANDNATGTAALLELARALADLRGRARLRIRLVLFVNEEPPFFATASMGSHVYAQRLKQSGEAIQGMLSLETLGFYSDRPHSQHYPPPLAMLYPAKGNFVAFVGLTSSRGFVRRTVRDFRALAPFPSVGGTAPGIVSGIDWSDHRSFGAIGVPALMVTDTAPFRYPHYHTREDTPDKVDYAKLARVVSGLEQVIRTWTR
jgi:Zn-dependent M28 family amino/carboxypeptidase